MQAKGLERVKFWNGISHRAVSICLIRPSLRINQKATTLAFSWETGCLTAFIGETAWSNGLLSANIPRGICTPDGFLQFERTVEGFSGIDPLKDFTARHIKVEVLRTTQQLTNSDGQPRISGSKVILSEVRDKGASGLQTANYSSSLFA